MKMRKMHVQDGFTLMELLAALTILGFVIAALYSFYFAGLSSFNRGIAQMDGQQSARVAMDKMVRELLYAVSIEIRAEDEIRFRLKGDNKVYRFRKAGQEIVFESLTGKSVYSHNKIALGITALHFSTDETHTVSIALTAGNGGKEVTLSSRVRPRNIP